MATTFCYLFDLTGVVNVSFTVGAGTQTILEMSVSLDVLKRRLIDIPSFRNSLSIAS